MKKAIAFLLVGIMCMALTGCSSKNPVTGYKKGDVTLGQYKGLTYTPVAIDVTDADVEDRILAELESHSEMIEVTDREVESGDTVNIDYVGKVNGVAFDNGTGNAPDLVIGSGQMIPGFEDGIIGMNVGETKIIDVTFPESYSNADLAGVDATFDITLNSISVSKRPDLTIDFVTETLKYDSIEAYRAAKRAELEAEAQEEADASKFSDVIAAAIENATFNKDLTEEITKSKENLIKNYDNMTQSYYGYDAATVFQIMYGWTADQFDSYMESQAKSSTEYNFLLSAVVAEEKISATAEEIAEYAESILGDYGVSSVQELYDLITNNSDIDGKTMVTEQVKLNKASELIVNSAVAE